MNVDLGLKIDKKDALTIVLLCVVFFSIAVVNLGATTYPNTVTQLTAGQSFYVNLGSQTNVKSMLIILYQGAFNGTISTGSPGNWTAVEHDLWPYSNGAWSEDYCKYVQNNDTGQNEVSVDQTTQYLKVDIGPVGSYETMLLQIAVLNQNDQIVTIQSITNAGTGNLDVNNLVNAQSAVHYPADYMENTYFDEIYFVRTAQEYMHLQMPIYEWTHPPLGKLIQAGGILIFGFTPFGWRIMGVIFATLMIALIYLVGKKLYGTWIGGFAAAFLLTFDFMHFTMGRLGTADTYVVFFSVASELFFLIYLKNVVDKGWKTSIIPLFLCIMFAALGTATKWVVLFGFAGALAILLVMRLSEVKKVRGKLSDKFYTLLDHPYSAIVIMLLLAILVYFIVYIPDMLMGRSFLDVLNLQNQMYIYHSTLTARNGWESPWYTWPFLFDPFNSKVLVPYWLELASLPNGTQSIITLLGNPAVWWVGFAAIIGLTVFTVPKILKKRFSFSLKDNLPAVFILVYFFFQWLVYIFISRGTYDYHFYSNVPFLCLASTFFINRYWSNKWVKVLTVAYFALVVALFVLFYPVISGVPTSTSTINSLKWFKDWVF
ncbi:MAG: glycosyltransferase family 39 protein [Candidatus Bathyarchaeia archaeon]